jgi:hypothetical protein
MPAGHRIDCMEGAWRESSIQFGSDFPTDNRMEPKAAPEGRCLEMRLAATTGLIEESLPDFAVSFRAPKPARTIRHDIRVRFHGASQGPSDDVKR